MRSAGQMYFNDASVTKVVPVGVRMGRVLWEKTSNATNTGLTIWELAFRSFRIKGKDEEDSSLCDYKNVSAIN